MRRHLVSLLLAGIILAGSVSAWPVLAQTAPTCQFAPVFLMLRDMIGRERSGECIGPMARNDGGDINQPTTRGMMTFRTTDLVSAFSDGQTTWLFGPNGLESRPTGTRLAWENTLPSVAPAPAAAVAIPPTLSAPPPPTVPLSPTPISNLPITIDGDETTTTKAIELRGGDYLVGWEAKLQRGRSSCYVGIRLRPIADQNPGQLLVLANVNTANDRSADGETTLFAVKPGTYVLDVQTTGCDWEVKFQPPQS
jgi:hypothetical protein